jgi:tetratricopeptide (TPR) repeat protein
VCSSDLRQAYFRKDYQQTVEFAKRATLEKPPFAPAFKLLATMYASRDENDESLETWREYEKLAPNDDSAPMNIGGILLKLKRPGEAIPELEAASEKFPRNAVVALQLGQAYLRSGNKEKAIPAFHKATELDFSESSLENAARELVEANVALDDALVYAQKAVDEEEELSTRISLANISDADLKIAHEMGPLWDTLGWVNFRLGHLEQAEKKVNAAWSLTQKGLIGDHLGQILEKEGKKLEAAHAFALAVASGGLGLDPALDSVQRLMGNAIRGDNAVLAAKPELSRLRTIQLPVISKQRATAEFYVLFTQGVPIPEIRFISGSDALRGADKVLSGAKFNIFFPDNHPAKLLRRGILSCEPAANRCDFVLLTPDMVRHPE